MVAQEVLSLTHTWERRLEWDRVRVMQMPREGQRPWGRHMLGVFHPQQGGW